MFEPLSAVAVLGFATGTLGFIVSTISKFGEKIQEIRECKTRLRSFTWQLEDVCMHLKVWHWIWIGKEAFPRDTYIHFWGIEGFASIQSRLDGITDLSNEIKDLLYEPVDHKTGRSFSNTEMEDWHQSIDHDVAQLVLGRNADHQKATLVRRIGFTLFYNTMLQEKISRLKSHVEGLRDFTQWTFRLEQHGDPNEKVTSAELHRISDLRAFANQFSNFGKLLYFTQESSRTHWAIELGPPEGENALETSVEVDTTYIDFCVRDAAPDVQPKAIRCRLYMKQQLAHWNEHLPTFVKKIDDIVLLQQQLDRSYTPDQFFDLLEMPQSRSRPLRQMLTENLFCGSHRKAFEVERADLVYGLGHWMILLWNTPWPHALCTCKIRCINLAYAYTRHSFFPWRGYTGCHHPTLAGEPLKLLGVALAEMALALPISVMREQGDINYHVGQEIASRTRLLGMLREKSGRNAIAKAVSYCLDPQSVSDLGHFERLFRNIVLPLEKYHKIINRHCQSTNGMRLRNEKDLNRTYDEKYASGLPKND